MKPKTGKRRNKLTPRRSELARGLLARAYLDVTAADESSKPLLRSNLPDDPLDKLCDASSTGCDEQSRISVRPDVAAAAVMTAGAIEKEKRLITVLRTAPPVATIATHTPDMTPLASGGREAAGPQILDLHPVPTSQCFERAIEIVGPHKNAVTAVANALVGRGCLHREEIIALLARHGSGSHWPALKQGTDSNQAIELTGEPVIQTVAIRLRHHSCGAAAAYVAVSSQNGKVISEKALPAADRGVRPEITFGDIADLAVLADLSLPLVVDVYALALPPGKKDGWPAESSAYEWHGAPVNRVPHVVVQISADIAEPSVIGVVTDPVLQGSLRSLPDARGHRPNAPFVIDQMIPSAALRIAKRPR